MLVAVAGLGLCLGGSAVLADTIAVIGTGNVGEALGPEFAAQGHTIVYGSREPMREDVQALVARTGNGATARLPAEAVTGADMVVLAVTGTAAVEVTRGLGDLTGKIIIDKDRFNAALDSSPTDVQELFGGGDGNGGVFGAVKLLIAEYTQAGGFVADVRNRLDTQADRIGARLDVLEAQLAIRRAALQQEFIAADRAMSQLNAQGNSLNQLGGQFRLFG